MNVAVWLLALAGLATAQNPDAAIVAPQRVGVGGAQRRISLEDAVELAMKANLEVAIERTNVARADQAIEASRAPFDPLFRWQPSFGNTNTPSESLLQGSNGVVTQRSASQTASFHVALGWNGLTLDASLSNSRITLPGNPFVSLTPFYVSQLTFTATQPLLRGRVLDAERAAIKIRAAGRTVSAADLETRAMAIAARVEQSYWDLVAARRRVDVDTESANLARLQLEQDRRMIEAGSLAQIELSAAQAGLDQRLDELYRSAGAVTEAENGLKTLVASGRTDDIWDDELIPIETGAIAPPSVIELKMAVDEGLRRRPELRAIAGNAEVNEVTRRQAEDALKPGMNLVLSYTLAGLGGKERLVSDPLTGSPIPGANLLPSSAIGGFGASVAGLFEGNYQSVSAGVSFDFPLHNRKARADAADAAIVKKQLEFLRARAEQAVAADVRNALQALETGRQRMKAANSGAQAAADKLASESRLFANGESTNFLVLTRQTDYAEARRRQVDAETAFNQAVAQYEAATGTALSSHGIVVE